MYAELDASKSGSLSNVLQPREIESWTSIIGSTSYFKYDDTNYTEPHIYVPIEVPVAYAAMNSVSKPLQLEQASPYMTRLDTTVRQFNFSHGFMVWGAASSSLQWTINHGILPGKIYLDGGAWQSSTGSYVVDVTKFTTTYDGAVDKAYVDDVFVYAMSRSVSGPNEAVSFGVGKGDFGNFPAGPGITNIAWQTLGGATNHAVIKIGDGDVNQVIFG